MTDNAIVIVEAEVRLGSLAVRHPTEIIGRATEIATALAKVVKDRKLSRQISGREYVYVDGWSTMGAMIGVLPREIGVIEHDNGDFEATVELIRVTDGAVVGQGSAIVGYDESTWKTRPRYAKRSMAITRATGKAYRLGFSWIMSLAGYATTPAEEMDGLDDHKPTPAPVPTLKPLTPLKPVTAEAIVAEVMGEVVPTTAMTLEQAMNEMTSDGKNTLYGSIETATLTHMHRELSKRLNGSLSAEERADKNRKHTACAMILAHREAQAQS